MNGEHYHDPTVDRALKDVGKKKKEDQVPQTPAKPTGYADLNDEFTAFMLEQFKKLGELFITKSNQYGPRDPLANFRTGARMEYGKANWETMYQEAKAYQRKHVAHIENNGVDGVKVGESLTDIAVYSMILLFMHRKYHQSKRGDSV